MPHLLIAVGNVVIHHGNNSVFRDAMFLHYLVGMACVSLKTPQTHYILVVTS